MNKIKKGDLLNGKFEFTFLDGTLIKQLSGFRSIVIGENDFNCDLDHFLIGKKYKRHFEFQVTMDSENVDKELANQKVLVKISDANITQPVVVESNQKPQLDELKKENEELKAQIAALNVTMKANEYLFKDKIMQASQKANEAIQEKTTEIQDKFAKEKEEIKKYALQKFIEEFSIPYNNLIAAVKSGENSTNDQVKNYCYGFSLVLKQLEQALDSSGIKVIEPNVGDMFNAHEQEVIDFEHDNDKQHEQIIKVVRLGFKLEKRTVVPAQVKINKNL
ncbi:nucleotide exchange factor GrpE [Mycoplasma sp. 3686d]|uniref:nucleotide exchange factor GrpE n=1 Tax=Mycoplasma sp. 3686d TaxID=2967300 RepID=UPI00211BCBFA|nr:nucleotide exchange factor GrpE [Mycoplasma sp. 3686d]UUM24704.1 nucleotide exchange factor GrpE [Mycoplasma sp. 3686d]